MSISFQIYLPELSSQMVVSAFNLLAQRGISITTADKSLMSDLSQWDGFVPLIISIQHNNPQQFESGLQVIIESFEWNKEIARTFKAIDNRTVSQLQKCTKLVTITAAPSVTAGYAISVCLASALTEAAGGILFDCESGTFDQLIQTIDGALSSDLADQFAQLKKKDTITTSRLSSLCKRLVATGKLGGWLAFKDLIIKVPIQDALLRCVALTKAAYEETLFEAHAVFLPLYVPQPCFALEYGILLENLQAKTTNRTSWHLQEAESLLLAINGQAEQFLSKATTALDFAQVAAKLSRSGGSFVEQEIAFSYAQAGDISNAKRLAGWLNFRYSLFRNNEDLNRIKELYNALNAGSAATKSFLSSNVSANIDLLEFQKISSMILQNEHDRI